VVLPEGGLLQPKRSFAKWVPNPEIGNQAKSGVVPKHKPEVQARVREF